MGLIKEVIATMTNTETKQIHFDPTDFRGMCAIMDAHGNSDSMYPGINENGEIVYISVYRKHPHG
jgi:hypothetical protein